MVCPIRFLSEGEGREIKILKHLLPMLGHFVSTILSFFKFIYGYELILDLVITARTDSEALTFSFEGYFITCIIPESEFCFPFQHFRHAIRLLPVLKCIFYNSYYF